MFWTGLIKLHDYLCPDNNRVEASLTFNSRSASHLQSGRPRVGLLSWEMSNAQKTPISSLASRVRWMFNDDKNYLDLSAPHQPCAHTYKKDGAAPHLFYFTFIYLITLSDQHLKLMEKKSAVAGSLVSFSSTPRTSHDPVFVSLGARSLFPLLRRRRTAAASAQRR